MLKAVRNKWNLIFPILSFILFSVFILYNSQKVGPNYDEIIELRYGSRSFDFYKSLGKDTAYMHDEVSGNTEIRYGNSFLMIETITTKIFSSFDKYSVIHFLVGICGILSILFVFLTVRTIYNSNIALFVAWCLFLTPTFTGLGFYQHKDIPFAMGYLASIYFTIRFICEFNSIKKLTIIGLILAFAFTIGSRIVGFLTLFNFCIVALILFVANFRELKRQKAIQKLVFIGIIIIACSYILGVLAYPYLVSSQHFERVLWLVDLLSKYPQRFPMMFDGQLIDAISLPHNYVSKLYVLQLPIFILIGLALLFPLAYSIIKKKIDKEFYAILFLVIVVIVPLFMIISKNSTLYNHLRHLTFITGALSLLSGVCIYYFYKEEIKHKALKIAFVVFIGALMLKTFYWSVKEAPYTSLYFNEFAGMFKEAGFNYERDYNPISSKECFDILLKDADLESRNKPITIITNQSYIINELVKIHKLESKIKVKNIGYRSFSEIDFDYAYYNDMFFTKGIRDAFFPMPQSIYVVKVDGVTAGCLVKKTDKSDYQGIEAISNNKLEEGLKLLEQNITKYPNNISIYPWLAYAYSEKGDWEKATKYYEKTQDYNINKDEIIFITEGNIYFYKQDYQQALDSYKKTCKLNPVQAYYKMALCYYKLKDKLKCKNCLLESYKINPSFMPTIQLYNSLR